jgi:hypothetical protein
VCGINNFFSTQLEVTQVSNIIYPTINRREFGDYQTNSILSKSVTDYIATKNDKIEFVLEPTCGEGNFILASIKTFPKLKKIVGIEIYPMYVLNTKMKILSHYLSNPEQHKPDIDIICRDVFQFDFKTLSDNTRIFNTLIVGNPPWITNTELSKIDSNNLPIKTNKLKGLDSMTGKSNFDLGESITNILLTNFDKHVGNISLLVKNNVVKNIVLNQSTNEFNISEIKQLNINSKKEFNVSVCSSVFLATFGEPAFTCDEYNFYNHTHVTEFGWTDNKFVYSIEKYKDVSSIEGISKVVWRSGLKHDCTKIMEFENNLDVYTNKLGETFNLESDLVYRLLKSSDLKGGIIDTSRKFSIVTQRKIGESTTYIKSQFPLTYGYLNKHVTHFNNRKSSVYNNKPLYSIFGIGDYSFKPYKVAISGLYKTRYFTLITPNNNKCIMVDDTCYFIGFDTLIDAEIAYYLLNSDLVQNFLDAIIFSDAKRSINKQVLMRIDLLKAINIIPYKYLYDNINKLSYSSINSFKSQLI